MARRLEEPSRLSAVTRNIHLYNDDGKNLGGQAQIQLLAMKLFLTSNYATKAGIRMVIPRISVSTTCARIFFDSHLGMRLGLFSP